MGRKLNNEEIIERFKEIHGGKYDYSKVEYVNYSTKVLIICPIHGEFWMRPAEHLKGQGCPKCGLEKRINERKDTTESFIEKAKVIHGDKYDYSRVKYVDSQTKVIITCKKCGTNFYQKPNNHLRGNGCPFCGNILIKNKLSSTTDDFIEKSKKIYNNKFDYSKVEYVNVSTKVLLKCNDCGNEFLTIPRNHLSGRGCPNCNKIKLSISKTKTLDDFIKKAKEVHGDKYDYSNTEYIKGHEKVCIICHEKYENGNEHGEFWQDAAAHLSGAGCPKCRGTKKSTTEEFIKRAKEIHGDKYDYSKVVYINNITKVCIICPKHGEFWQSPKKHLQGNGCPECGRINTMEKQRLDRYEFIWKAIQKHGYKFDYREINYEGSTKSIKLICPIHGEFWQLPYRHLDSYGCPKCGLEHFSSRSAKEIEVFDFIKENYDGIVLQGHRKILSNFNELDIYLPELNLAFEFDGLRWHNENNKPNNYHLDKTKQCEDKEVKLIHIFEDEWDYKKEIVKSRILGLIGKISNKISVKDCNIKVVPLDELKDFLTDNHILGYYESEYNYGLYYNDELIYVITSSSNLISFCNKIGYNVIGGAQRLLTHFINEVKPNEIIAHADKRWTNGLFYERLGFEFVEDSEPNYYYIINNKRYDASDFSKDLLIEQGFDEDKTEHEIMLERKIYRIYDCGTKIYKMNPLY